MPNQQAEATLPYDVLQQALQTLLRDLRRHGFKTGLDQFLAAQHLFLSWQNQPELSTEVIRASLGALFCTSLDEQQRFPALFQRWYDGCRPQPIPVEPIIPLKPTWFATVKSSKTAILLIVILLSLLTTALYSHFKTIEPPMTEIISGGVSKSGGETTESNTPSTQTYIPKPKSPPEPIIVPAYYYSQYDAGLKTLLVLPGLIWLGWLLAVLQKRFIALHKRRKKVDEKIRLENLPFKTDNHGLFPTAALKSVWQAWRRFQPFRSRRLHKAKTVRSTLQQNGYFQAVYRDRLLPPEYVLLIDRHHYLDFTAKLGHELKQRLQTEGLFVNQYYYDTDPHYCWPVLANGRFFSLQQLADRHHGSNLIVIGEARSFYRASSGKIIPMGTGNAWISKALLTSNTPEEWYESEHMLVQAGFQISPFTRRGLQQLLSYGKNGQRPQALENAKTLDYRDVPLPTALRDSAFVWLINRKPPKSRRVQTLAALKSYLGTEGFSLLAAVAAYPALDWKLTLALDCQLQLPADEHREIRLRKLARLPWFRNGNLPEVWRRAIIQQLNQKQLNDLSACFQALLNVENPTQGLIDLPVAIPDISTAKQDQAEWLNTAKHGDPLQDLVFASVIRGRKPKPWEFSLSYPLKKWLPPQYWRGLVLPVVAGLLIASTVSIGLFKAWQYWGNQLLDQQAEQRMRKELGAYTVSIIALRPELKAHAEALQSQLSAWGFSASVAQPNAEIARMVIKTDNAQGNNNKLFFRGDPAKQAKVLDLAKQRISYLTYNAPVDELPDIDLPNKNIAITLRQAYQPLTGYRDFIRLQNEEDSESLNAPVDTSDTIDKIIRIFEMGTVTPDFGKLDVFADGPKGSQQIHYGFYHETEFGNLQALLKSYSDHSGAYAKQFAVFIPQIGQTALTDNEQFKALLKQAAQDPIMQQTQTSFFNDRYMVPAKNWAAARGITTQLGIAVICDSFVQSGAMPAFLLKKLPPIPNGKFTDTIQERNWIMAYLKTRRDWLANHANPLLHNSVFRPDSFLALAQAGNWQLNLPIKVEADGQTLQLDQ